MNPWLALKQQSAALEPWQLLLMLLFLLGYLGAIGRLLDVRGRWRAALLATLSGSSLCLLMAPWVLGALMLAAAVGVIGLFSGLVMLLGRMLGLDRRVVPSSFPAADLPTPATPPGVRGADPLTVT